MINTDTIEQEIKQEEQLNRIVTQMEKPTHTANC